jgi:Uri superfamily endonuclease
MKPPEAGGTYVLLAELCNQKSFDVGRLGTLDFAAGVYAYVGSAHGPGGLRARLGRYFAGSDRKHWHVDFLLEHAEVAGALFRVEHRRLECIWARWIGVRAGSLIPGFGSSDCRCSSHLFFVGDSKEMEEMIGAAGCELKATHLLEGDDGL